jgi:hypothetical protein
MGQISSYFLLGPDGKLQEEPKPGAERGTSLTQRALGLTRTGQVVYKAYSLFRRPKAATAVKAELTDQEKAVREEAWSITEQVLERFHREVSADGARFALVVLPDMREIDPQGQFGERTRIAIERLTALGQRAGFPVHAIAQTFSDAASKSGSTDFTYGCDTTHWNPKGHRLAAEAIRDALASAGVVAARN